MKGPDKKTFVKKLSEKGIEFHPKAAAKTPDATRSKTVMMAPNSATPFEWSNLHCKLHLSTVSAHILTAKINLIRSPSRT